MPPAVARIRDVSFSFEDYKYRTPIKFGGVALSKATVLNVAMQVEAAGKTVAGYGSMPLSNVWAFPSKQLAYDDTLGAMIALVEQIADVYRGCKQVGHPIDITHLLEPEFFPAARAVGAVRKLAEPIPPLATLVVASPFDAALHDGYGKALGLNCYKTYGRDLVRHDLGHYLGHEFEGGHLSSFLKTEPSPKMPLYHLVGALDPLTAADVKEPVGDGLPETLAEWIAADGLTHMKVKLNGDDTGWDVDRVMAVNAVAEEVQRRRGVTAWHYSLDFNERCKDVAYLVEFLSVLRAKSPAGYDRVQYVEQPTARDLKANRSNVMHEAAKLKPVVIDESLIDLESLLIAREMGYTGVAFKACKGQTQTLLLAAAAQIFGMFRCVQDLTCPGASLIHSAGVAAHIPGVAAIEANSRQYCPIANVGWDDRYPGVFTTRDGSMNTAILNGPGLGAA